MGDFPVQRINPVEAYASAVSVRPGDGLDFHVSVAQPAAGELVRLEVFHHSQVRFDSRSFQEDLSAIDLYKEDYRGAIKIDPGQAPLLRASFPGKQLDPPAYPDPAADELADASRGCGWETAFRFSPVPGEWKSGVHLARVSYLAGVTYVLFVVRPRVDARRARILCQLATHTYQAYNPWQDRCFYADLPPGTLQAAKVSFDRPCHLWKFILFDQSFIAWLDRNYVADYCTSADLHADRALLDGYRLFISLGHDEYWTGEMRDSVESFVERGGNAAFFTGNSCYWQVRLEDNDRTLVCYKDRLDLDRQQNPDLPAARRTGKWYEPPVSRPTSAMTGLSFRTAAAITVTPRPKVGFTVERSGSWVFAGTRLADGDVFGQEDAIVGYECDARDAADPGTPRDLITLATVRVDTRLWNGNPPDGRGEGSIVLFRKGRGCVVSAGTTGWGQGLRDPAGQRPTFRITRNIVDRLQAPIAHALYAVTAEGDLLWFEDWLQDGTGGLTGPRLIGRGGWNLHKQVLSGREGIVYAISATGDLLWYQDPSGDGTADIVGPKTIGVGGWDRLAQVTASAGGVLYAVDGEGNLLRYRDANRDGTGLVAAPQVIGHGGWDRFRVVTAADDGALYAVTADGDLLWFKDANRDGAAEVAGPKVIGRGGWDRFKRVLAGDQGVVYAVTADGDLLWYRDEARDGSAAIVGPLHGVWQRFVALA